MISLRGGGWISVSPRAEIDRSLHIFPAFCNGDRSFRLVRRVS